jgi:hypothetical protein
MASGFFPLDTRDADGAELARMANRIDEIAREKYDAAIECCVPEDAASDGGYVERLTIAAGFIRDTLKPTT